MPGLELRKLHMLAVPLLVLSFVTNLAILVSPIYMMQVLDRVVPSGNISTLVLLMAIALGALAVTSMVEAGRDRSLGRVGRWVDQILTGRVLNLPDADQPARLEQLGGLRSFLNGPHIVAILNLFWLPMFFVALGLIHVSYVLLVAAIVAASFAVRHVASQLSATARGLVDQSHLSERRLRQQLTAAGEQRGVPQIADALRQRLVGLIADRQKYSDELDGPNIRAQAFSGFMRAASQLLAISLGAYLVSQNLLSAGGMIAASIIASKTIGTAEQAIAAIRPSVDARAAFRALQEVAPPAQTQSDVFDLSGSVRCNGLIYPRGGGASPRLNRVGFELVPGTCLAIIGDAASGKSTLLRAMAGIDPAPIGTVFLDQTDVRHLSHDAQKKALGFMPQHAGLLPGTVAQNICGFDPEASDETIIEAAKLAQVHGMVSALPEGYNTDLSAKPYLLTPGQCQMIAFASTLYHRPKYLFLDEPNSLLDRNFERMLCEVLGKLKEQGITVVMILHRSGLIGLADQVLVLDRGQISDIGPRAEVLGRQNDGKRRIRFPLKETSLQDLSNWISSQFTRDGDAPFATKAALLGTEMFLGACLNGPADQAREVEVGFKFVNETSCEIHIIEDRPSAADKIMIKVRKALEDGEEDWVDFSDNERPLVLAGKLASQLVVRNQADRSHFMARIENSEGEHDEGPRH